MTRTAKISIIFVSAALFLVVLIIINKQEIKVADYYEGISSVPEREPVKTAPKVELPKIDQAKLQEEYQGQLKGKVQSIKDLAEHNQPFEDSLRVDLMAMTVPSDFRNLHLALVRLVTEEGESGEKLARVKEVTSQYAWLNY